MNSHPQLSDRELTRVSRVLRSEFVSGIVVIAAATLGFIAANSPVSGGYRALRDFTVGPEFLHLNLSLGTWAADGLLAVFFFVVGLELKREFVDGALSKPATAIVPVAAAVGGVAVPALIYFAWNAGTSAAGGWAIPTATDIAFAVTVLGLVAPRIPPALRLFLLTLAVVDDLIAIVIIAIFYTSGLQTMPIALAVGALAVYWLLSNRFADGFARYRFAAWVVLLPIGVLTWALVHASGLHATIAGVLLAFAIPVRARSRAADTRIDLAGEFAHRFSPLSGLIAVPIFAFFASGVSVSGESRFPFDPIALGIIAGLVVGKPVGIVLTTWLVTRFTRATFGTPVRRSELLGVAALGGIGFTVSLLITELSFTDQADADTARLAVMAGSVLAAVVAAAFLVWKPKRSADPHPTTSSSV